MTAAQAIGVPLLLARIAGMGREGVIEGLAINVLAHGRQVPLNRDWKVIVESIGHDVQPMAGRFRNWPGKCDVHAMTWVIASRSYSSFDR